ncbi:conjugal transfer protein TraO [Xenorhabdus sp. KJ12.1]|uniref:conjugal transfer protein TraO n=1 Tax=Xenorhabdus sp. KJ12.1 TaxID=1851571 RepID=UPI000C03AE93|nr:conjugal transfer protein TraO [Xenorhabdus sp. KJ12.1]PHM67996.1 IcmE [Xenorhabdus sp. KJ12.1]
MTAKKHSMKKLAIVIAGIVAAGVVIGIVMISSGSDESTMAAPSKVVNKSTRIETNDTDDDESYRLLLQQYNEINTEKALATGTSYVGMSQGKTVPSPDVNVQQYDWEKQTPPTQPARSSNQQSSDNKQEEEFKKRRLALLQKIEDKRGVPEIESIIATTNLYAKDIDKENKWPEWSRSLFPETAATASSQTGTQANDQPDRGVQLVEGLSAFPSVVDTKVDSDNQNMKMVARIASGKLRGAKLFSEQLALAGNGIQVKFTEMQWNGQHYQIEAYAVEPGTKEFAIASDVNNRWLTRIVLPALAFGIGQTGSLYKDSNSSMIVTPNGTAFRSQGRPNSEAIAGTIAGGIGEQAGRVLSQEFSKLPVKQVTVDAQKVIGIQFIKPVYSSDIINK